MRSTNSGPSLTAASPTLTPQTPVEQADDNTEESIRTRAFQLYEERGMVDGHAEEDWLQAELEIRSRMAGKAA